MDSDKKDMPSNSGHGLQKEQLFEAISAFSDDRNFVLHFKKGEKLATAVYMLTNFMGDEEPLKWKLRELMGELLSLMIVFKDKTSSERQHWGYEIKKLILDISSRLEVASFAGLISPMNVDLLKKEFGAVLAFISESGTGTDGRMLLSGDIFHVSLPPAATSTPKPVTPPVLYEEKPVSYADTEEKAPVLKRDVLPREKGNKHDNRKGLILDLVRKKNQITIKDVSLVVKNCSEKTIQRELLALVHEGVLKKEGERRWSRYSLA